MGTPAPRDPLGLGREARVLMTADAVGGVWTYALDLASGLSARGAKVTLAVAGPLPSRDQRAAAEQVAGLTLVDTGLPLDWTAAARAEVEEAGRALAALARDGDFDLAHLNSPALAAAGPPPVPTLGVCHSCVATWWDAAGSGPLPEDLAWRRDLVARGYRHVDALVAPSSAFAAATRRAYAMTAAPMVVPNGRDAAWRTSSGSEEVSVFAAGRLWDKGKNLAALDEAAGRLSIPVRAAGPLIGPNEEGIALRHVEALGVLPEAEVLDRLAARPIFAAPALYEPFGLAVLEAARAGCALVLSDIPTFRELWDGAALFVAPRDAEALAAALAGLASDGKRRERLGEAARLRAERFTVAAMVEGTLRAYGRVLAGRRSSEPVAEAAA